MPVNTLSNFVLLPELKLIQVVQENRFSARYECFKIPREEYCPKCASRSETTYDHRWIRVKDDPIRGSGAVLQIRKRRLWCKTCQKPFSEPIAGIQKGKRHTERFVRAVSWACETFSDLKKVRRAYKCSAGFLYEHYYKTLERKVGEKVNYPWPTTIGIDEHSFRKNRGKTEFASMIVDYNHGRVRELVYGKTSAELMHDLAHIPGRENVKNVALDLCDPFKNFAREFFPNARLIADKFHVLRLITPALIRKRYEITGTRADAKARRLLTMSAHKLDYWDRRAILDYLERYPELRELYSWKERLHGFYRIKGFKRACVAFTYMTDEMAHSTLSEIKTLRRTLLKWRNEILAYFETGITNARTEGFNNIAKLVQRRAFGYKSFRNYRLKVLTACAA